jgi:hypothetical protein
MKNGAFVWPEKHPSSCTNLYFIEMEALVARKTSLIQGGQLLTVENSHACRISGLAG